jgi:hypothetical protein
MKRFLDFVNTQLQEETKELILPKAELNLSRELLPQIAQADLDEFLNYCREQGVTVTTKTVDPASLKPTQGEFDQDKVLKMMGQKNDRAIVISNDDHVLDGHHLWLAKLNDDKSIRAHCVDMPIMDLLNTARRFPKAFFKAVNEAEMHDVNEQFEYFLGAHDEADRLVEENRRGNPGQSDDNHAKGTRSTEPRGASPGGVRRNGTRSVKEAETIDAEKRGPNSLTTSAFGFAEETLPDDPTVRSWAERPAIRKMYVEKYGQDASRKLMEDAHAMYKTITESALGRLQSFDKSRVAAGKTAIFDVNKPKPAANTKTEAVETDAPPPTGFAKQTQGND